MSFLESRREILLAAGLAAAAGAVALLLPIPGGDVAAHLYRTYLVRHGALVWDNRWFAGSYPLLSYSLLYYLPAAVVGNAPLGLASAVACGALFASILGRRWGSAARWPSRSFAIVVSGQLFTAAYPFTAGTAALLASVWCLQRRRFAAASLAAALTVAFSPLAFFFLVLAAVAMAISTRRLSRGVVAYGLVLAGLGGSQLAVVAAVGAARLVYPFGLWRFLAGAGIGVAVRLLLRRRGFAAPLGTLFAVWTVALAGVYLVPTAIGQNALRASIFLFPLVLLVAVLRRFRPRLGIAVVLVAALSASTVPYLTMIGARTTDALAQPGTWSSALRYLHRHETTSYRVEVVPTANHWEAYYVAAAGFALARGWYRQLDLVDNRAVYAPTLDAVSYDRWLRSEGVRYVVLPAGGLEAIDGAREAALLRSGRSGLRRVWMGKYATIYRLPHATPILSGPGRASIVAMGTSRIDARASRPGRYLLRVHYTPDWVVRPAGVCVERAPRSLMTDVVVRRAGRFTLTAAEQPLAFVEHLLDDDDGCGGSGP